MTSAQVATLREEASLLLYQMPEEVLAPLIGLMKGITWQAHKTGSATPAVIGVSGIPAGGQSGGAHFGSPAVRVEPGFAAGEFVFPDDFDADNELIADLFEGKQ